MAAAYKAAGAEETPAVFSNLSAEPPYQQKHSGSVLVCGFGPTFYDDLARVRAIRPDAPAIAINEAAKGLRAFAIFTLHPDKLKRFRELQILRYGEGFTCHSGGRAYEKPNREQKFPLVDHWWAQAAGGGTSAWAAARMARLMGFDEIILVGVPLIHGNYADKGFAKAWRVGQKREDGREMLQSYRDYVAQDVNWHAGVKSMSGFTRDLFGEPA